MERIPITKAGFERLKKELEMYKNVLIPENIKDIEDARGHGDLSENAEYTAAKERQAYLQSRIKEIENNLALLDVIEIRNCVSDKVVFGSSVKIVDIDSGEEKEYQLVGPLESDISKNMISVTAPLGKALIGKKVGDTVNVITPGGLKRFEVIEISVTPESN